MCANKKTAERRVTGKHKLLLVQKVSPVLKASLCFTLVRKAGDFYAKRRVCHIQSRLQSRRVHSTEAVSRPRSVVSSLTDWLSVTQGFKKKSISLLKPAPQCLTCRASRIALAETEILGFYKQLFKGFQQVSKTLLHMTEIF